MISINAEKCIGCGKCVRDCFPHDIEIIDKKASPKGRICMECGHCIAICPRDAITLMGYNMEEVIGYEYIDYEISPRTYLNHLKYRRSIRDFKSIHVSKNDIENILEAGRYSPTGGNLQNVSYFVVKKDIKTFHDLVMRELKIMGDEDAENDTRFSFYSDYWLEMWEDYKNTGTDNLFFNADTVIVVSSPSPQAAIISAAHMETMIYCMGLGMLYSGFCTRAINHSQYLKEYIQLKPDYGVHATIIVGHPKPDYLRTVPRKPVDAVWK